MDLGTVDRVLLPRSRADLPPGSADAAVVAGGTWLFSEKQDHLTTLIDITALGWEPLIVDENGLGIAATCTIETLARFESAFPATTLFPRCAAALLASFKIWKTATVGGNVALALPAGAMISLTAALDGVAEVWSAHGPSTTTVCRSTSWSSAPRPRCSDRGCAAQHRRSAARPRVENGDAHAVALTSRPIGGGGDRPRRPRRHIRVDRHRVDRSSVRTSVFGCTDGARARRRPCRHYRSAALVRRSPWCAGLASTHQLRCGAVHS